MIRYLLDANIISDMVTSPFGLAARRVDELPEKDLGTSIIVAAEVRYGLEKRQSRRLVDRVEAVLTPIHVLAFEAPADAHYARLRADLERKGTPISANDMLIAAHALALDAVLVTDNEREFRRVPGLRVENWLRA